MECWMSLLKKKNFCYKYAQEHQDFKHIENSLMHQPSIKHIFHFQKCEKASVADDWDSL